MTILRSTTFQLEVKNEDGVTKMRTFSRVVTDAKETTKKLNETLGDNVTVTSKTANTTAELTRQARAQVTQMERSNRVYKSQAEQLRHQINLIDKTELEQAQLNAQFRLGANATEEQRQEIAQLTAEHQRLTQAQGGTQGSMRNLRGVAQNFGWQMQDVAVQMQMGTDAFIIFSQQGSQIASSFGAWGALAGAGIAIIGAAIPPLIAYLDDTTTSTKDLEDAQKSLNEIFKTSKFSVKGYTDELVELFEIDKQLAELKILTSLIQAEKIFKDSQGKIKEYASEIDELGDGFRFTNSLQEEFNEDVEDMAKKFGITTEEVLKLNKAYQGLVYGGSTEDLVTLFKDIGTNSKTVTDEFKNLALEVATTAFEAGLAQDKIDKLNAILTDGLDPLMNNTKSVRSLADEYRLMTDQLGMTDRQLAVDNFLRQEALKLTPEQIKNTVRSMNSYFDEADAIKFRTQALEDDMKFEQERLKGRKTVLDPIEQSFDFNGGGNVVEQELQRNKEVTEALSAQMIRTKEWEYSERAKINRLMEAEEKRHLSLIGEAQMQLAQTQVMTVSSTVNMMSSLVNEMSDGGERIRQQMEEMNGAQKAMFFLTRSIMAVEAFINGILLGSKLATIFPTAAPAMISLGTGIGAAQSGAIMGSTFAGFFDNGGFIPQGQSGIVSEYRDELVNGVMVKGPARVTSSDETAKMMNGGGLNVSVINNAPGVSHSVQQVDEKTVRIIAEETFNKNIDKGVATSLSKKGSKTDKAMRRNYNTSGKY